MARAKWKLVACAANTALGSIMKSMGNLHPVYQSLRPVSVLFIARLQTSRLQTFQPPVSLAWSHSLRAAARKNQAGWSWVEVVHGAVRRLGWNEPHS